MLSSFRVLEAIQVQRFIERVPLLLTDHVTLFLAPGKLSSFAIWTFVDLVARTLIAQIRHKKAIICETGFDR
jgi:hypothetical protein